ncbi:condensation domain-containing protein, partial [Alcanivorax profundi]|uniref:condensation domain-containing protein n=1 Tax=Alcanivorax profundi TaxID=2338368 RepID=UPI0032B1AD36
MTGSANNTAHPGPQWSPLSCSQQRLWLFSRLSPGSTAYNISGIVWLDGELDVPALQDTMRYILARQEITNARFAEIDGVAWQRPVPRSPDDIPLVDLSNDADPLARAYQEARQLNARPFDLEAESPARFRLVRLAATRHAILVSMHHIIGDAWSLGVFLQEFLFSYSAFRSGVQPAVPPLKKQYVEWAENEAQWLKGEAAASQLSYWTDTLEHEGEPLALPRLKQDAGASHPACCNDFSLSAEDNRELKQLATQLGVSRFTVLLAAFQYLLARVSGQQQVRVGVPSANRKGSNQFLIGFFVNNLVIQGRVQPGMTVRDWVAQIHAALDGAKQHRDLPFDRVVDALCRSRDQGSHPLFQVAFNYRQQGKGMKLDLGNLTVTAEDVPVTETPFDLVLDAWPDTDGGLGLRLVHGEGVLSDDFARYLREAFVGLLQQWLHNSELTLAESDVLPPADLARLQQWQQQGQDDWHWQSYPALFAAQAQRQQEAVALVHGDHRCTFAQLDARSNQLAQYLLQQGVTADEVIAVSFERGIAMIEAFLAVMKAGAAFLPLDPAYPSERLHYMLEDSGARWLLTASGLVSALPDVPGLKKVPLDSLSLQGFSTEPVGVNVHPDQLAYVIYTSGSTGKPKGVALTHGGLSMHVQTIGKRYGMTPQ